MKFLFSIVFYFCALSCFENKLFAEATLAFIEFQDIQGRPIQLVPNGRFAHVAIAYKDLWLHSYPGRPVELISTTQLLKLGAEVEFVTISRPALTFSEIQKFLGQEYDSEFDWNDTKMYCSELVAKILKIPPRPMNFNAPIWPPRFRKKNGRPGMSPDGLYRILKLY